MLLEVAERHISGTLHLSGSTRANRYEFALLLAHKFDLNETLLNPVKARPTQWVAKRPCDSSLNVTKAQKGLLSKPATLDEALNEFAEQHHSGATASSPEE
jgi:dTDP-4-dehydrorhamnose reductase